MDSVVLASLPVMLAISVSLGIVSATAATAVERRAGPRWLLALWATWVGVFIVVGLAHRFHPSARESGARAAVTVLIGAAVGLGLPHALATIAAWRLGQRATRPRPRWVQWTAAVGAFVLGMPVGLAASIALDVAVG